MPDISAVQSIGTYAVPVSCISPQSAPAGTITGAVLDRFSHNMPMSCVVYQSTGAVGGSPSGVSVITGLQDSADGVNFAAYAPAWAFGSTQQTPALTAANSGNSLACSLSSARRYIRLVTVVALTGGTSPTVLVAAGIVLGGESYLAAI